MGALIERQLPELTPDYPKSCKCKKKVEFCDFFGIKDPMGIVPVPTEVAQDAGDTEVSDSDSSVNSNFSKVWPFDGQTGPSCVPCSAIAESEDCLNKGFTPNGGADCI